MSAVPSAVRGESLNCITINDRADPRVADYTNLKERDLASRSAAFIAEGELVVRRLIRSRFKVRSLFLSDDRVDLMADAARELRPGTPVYVAPATVVHDVIGFPIHRGILGAGDRGAPCDLGLMLEQCTSLIVLEDIANLDNMGGVFRTVAALGGSSPGVLLSPGCCDPLYRKGIRVSMGWALRVPFATLDPWPDGLAAVAEAGFTIAAMTPGEGAIDLEVLASNGVGRPAVLLGTEGRGLSDGAMKAAAFRCRVPMNPEVDSLNVVVAGAVALSRLMGSHTIRAGNKD